MATTTTDANGIYLFNTLAFAGLNAGGNYVLVIDSSQAALNGFAVGPLQSGTNRAIDNDLPAPTGSRIALPVQMPADGSQNIDAADGGFLRLRIGSYVWADANGDGVQDTGEVGLPDVVVQLCSADGTPLATTSTDEDGLYEFTSNEHGVLENTSYELKIDRSSPPLNGEFRASPLAGTADPQLDSNGVPHPTVPELVTAPVTTGSFGAPPSYTDFGFYRHLTIGDKIWVNCFGKKINIFVVINFFSSSFFSQG